MISKYYDIAHILHLINLNDRNFISIGLIILVIKFDWYTEKSFLTKIVLSVVWKLIFVQCRDIYAENILE